MSTNWLGAITVAPGATEKPGSCVAGIAVSW